jgi:hypothetical protein
MGMIDVDEFLLPAEGLARDVRQVLRTFDVEGQVLYVQEMFWPRDRYSLSLFYWDKSTKY